MEGGTTPIELSHDPSILSPDSTLRDLFATYAVGASPGPGAVLAKRVYKRNPDGSKGSLGVVFLMHKQNSGYFPQGGDFNYYAIPGNTVTAALPNGDFSQAMRTMGTIPIYGKSAYCADCHSRAGSDYLFSR